MHISILGSLEDVLYGKVSKSTLQRVELSSCAFGLGASVKMKDGEFIVAESITYDHVSFAYSPKTSWKEDQTLDSPFYVAISEKPQKQLRVNEQQSIEKLYSKLLGAYPKGFVVCGEAHFSQFNGMCITKAPVNKEPILDKLDDYVTKINLSNVHGKIFGVVSNKYDHRLFYEISKEKKLSCFSHTHALFDKQALHLLTESIILEGNFHLSPLDL